MKPEWCPQWAWDKSDYLRQSTRETIARALLDAHQRGRREGMEEAARYMDDRSSEWRRIGNVTSNTFANIYEDEAAAIRAKMEEQPCEFGDGVTVRTTRS